MKRQSHTILLIDDSDDDLAMTIAAFRALGVKDTIHTVWNGAEAIRYLQGEGQFADRKTYHYPSIIITDLKMPIMDGFSVLEHLKNHPAWRIVPVIVLSSGDDTDDIRRSYALGAASYFTKPGSLPDLQDLLRSLHDYWIRCEVPQADDSGKHLGTDSTGKLGQRFSD